MTDLNTAIVKYKGWKHNPDGFDLGLGNDVNFKYQSPDGKLQSKLPDFEHDARLYMALFEEMGKNNNYFLMLARSDVPSSTWECCYGGNFEDVSYSDTIGTAICLAYCKLNGLECEG